MNVNKAQSFSILALFLLLPISALAIGQGDPLPSFTGTDMDGKKIDMATVIGKKPVMLVFWASWCPTCKTEVPKVNEQVKKYRSKGMEFIGINVGFNDSVERARKFMTKTGMNYPVLFDDKNTISRMYGVQGVPTIVMADKSGRIVFKNYGVPDITDDDFKGLMGK